jgi:uncharacterized protein YfaS (alpha-2-macroglobulin family)
MGQTVDPKISAEVGYALALAIKAGYPIDDSFKSDAATRCSRLYDGTNRWEDRALLAASLSMLGASTGSTKVNEVLRRGQSISPFARLRLAEALVHSNRAMARNSESATVEIRDAVLHSGQNSIDFTRTGDGEAFFAVEAQTYRPSLAESIRGVRIARRFETRNRAGIWTEVARPIKVGSEVRCTVVVWGDDIPDAMKVMEPIPAGFEFIDDEENQFDTNREERDGAMIHFFANSGAPIVFRYYLRAESEGSLIALPAVGKYLRRPGVRGNSSATDIVVKP